jgi:hypothetical protein
MASFQLGAIFTDIAGSVAGTTFRRTPRGIIGYNKQRSQIKSAFSKNNVRVQLAQIFSAWRLLDKGVQGRWNDLALLYPQTDKFGNVVYYTGRQFYTKLNSQLIPTYQVVDLDNFDDQVCTTLVTGITSDLDGGDVVIHFNENVGQFYLMVQAYKLRVGSNAKPSKRCVNTFVGIVGNMNSYNIEPQFIEQFGVGTSAGYYGFNIRFMSLSGFQSPLQTFAVEIS